MKNVGTAFQNKGKAHMKIMYIGECGMFKTKQGYWVGGGGSFKTEGTYTYTYGWLMLMYGRKQHSTVKQLSFN